MELRRLGKSNLEISVLGVGCWPFGGGNIGETKIKRTSTKWCTWHSSWAQVFDTAEVYNDARQRNVSRHRPEREANRAIISSKVTPAHTAP